VHAGERYGGPLLPLAGKDTGVTGVVRFARPAKPVCAQRIARKRLSSGSLDRFSGNLGSILSSPRRARDHAYKAVMHDLSHHRCRTYRTFLEPYQRQKWASLPFVPDRHHPPHPRVVVSRVGGPYILPHRKVVGLRAITSCTSRCLL